MMMNNVSNKKYRRFGKPPVIGVIIVMTAYAIASFIAFALEST